MSLQPYDTYKDRWVCYLHGATQGPYPCRTQRMEPTPPEYQHYWRCEHHPSALENFFRKRHTCEWMCHAEELRWHHHGNHPPPKSWGTPYAP